MKKIRTYKSRCFVPKRCFFIKNIIYTQQYLLWKGLRQVLHLKTLTVLALSKKCPYSELFWSPFSSIFYAFSPYSVRMRENADQNNSEQGHFSRRVERLVSVALLIIYFNYFNNSLSCLSKTLSTLDLSQLLQNVTNFDDEV